MKRYIFILLFTFCEVVSANPIWQREIINYSYTDYNAGFQNWMITQSDKGWIYAANTAGLLEFDGLRWSLYHVNKDMTRSVRAVKDRIYVGGSSEFGYFEPNQIGLLTYKSLSQALPPWGGEVWRIWQIAEQIYFVSDNSIHIYNPGNNELQMVESKAKITSSTVFEDRLLVGTAKGLASLIDHSELQYIDYSADIAQHKIVEMLPYKEKLLVVTAWGGIFTLDHNRLEKAVTKADSFIKNNQLFSATITESLLILGSVRNGVYIADLEDKNSYSEHINISNGIINNTVLNVFTDKEHNLWLALDKGMSYVNLNSPIRPLYANISPIGTGHCSILYNGRLYLGTNQGVYTFADNTNECYLLEGTEGQIWSMSIIDDKLFCSGDNNITVITPSERYHLNLHSAWEVCELREDQNKIVVGTYSGFSVLEKQKGKWHYSRNIESTYGSMRGFIEDSEPYTFWYTKEDNIAVKISFDPTLNRSINEKTYELEGRLVGENKYFRQIGNNIILSTSSGVMRYERLSDSFVKYRQLESLLEGETIYQHLSIDRLGSIWFSTDRAMKILPYKQGQYENKANSLGSIINELTDNHHNIFRLDSLNGIIATDNGFSLVSLKRDTIGSEFSIQSHIRSLSCTRQDSAIYYGGSDSAIRIPYTSNSIRIQYGATVFSGNADFKYLFRLKNKEPEWSNLTSNTSKEYTDLFEGNYEFEVKALNNIDGRYTNLASIKFTILPPWYRTAYAYFAYLLVICTALYFVYILTIDKQKKIINLQKQESIIKDKEIYELQNKNLKDELHYKTQELSGYILNVIRKNEILEDVKKRAFEVSRAIDEDRARTAIKQKVVRLISQIDNNIEKDKEFEVFQSNFDIVHQNFFKQLDEQFPDLSRNDKILCAYLNMNLSSKEIAPLLNISIRGVEVGRYRLRKKLNLTRDVNLIEFLQNM